MTKQLKVWIVEDDDTDVNRAFEVVRRLRPTNARFFRERTIRWGSRLTELPVEAEAVDEAPQKHMPDIVILDLFDDAQRFGAADFYRQLRSDEIKAGRDAAFVIVWSVKTGIDEVESFVNTKPILDRRLMFTGSKSQVALEQALERVIRSWEEAALP